jgi:hypothetical protein
MNNKRRKTMSRTTVDAATFKALRPVSKEDVPLPEFGDGVVISVWGMTAGERTRFEQSMQGKSGPIAARVAEIRERLVIACCKTDDGQPMFTVDDIDALRQQPADIIERIVNVAQRLSGFSAADIEATAKN